MLVVLRGPGGEREVEIDASDPATPVSALVERVIDGEPQPPGTEWQAAIDGVRVPLERRIDRAGIPDGAILAVTPVGKGGGGGAPGPEWGRRSDASAGDRPATAASPAERSPERDPMPVAGVAVVGGLAAGPFHPLAPGCYTIGRQAAIRLAAATVSARHAAITVGEDGRVTVADLGSTNGTWRGEEPLGRNRPARLGRDDVIRLGAVEVQAIAGRPRPSNGFAARRPRREPRGTATWNRPPRRRQPTASPPLEAPAPPAPGSASTPLSVASLLVPVLMGAVMAEVFHSLIWGLFALLGPLMFLGTWWEQRRRTRKGRRRDTARWARELTTFTEQLARRAADERRTRLALLPDLAELRRRALDGDSGLWERRAADGDFLILRTGTGRVRWSPPVAGDGADRPDEIDRIIEGAAVLADCPVGVDLATSGVLGIAGPRDAALAVARGLIVQAAVLHGPADVALAVLTDGAGAADWDWVKWLPHTIDHRNGRRRLAATEADAEELVRDLVDQRTDAPAVVTVVDDPTLPNRPRSAARTLLRGAAGPLTTIVIAPFEEQLPARCGGIVSLRGPDGRASLRRTTGDDTDDLLACGMDEPTAREVARALARFDDPEAVHLFGQGLPARARLLPLLGFEQVAADEIARRWARRATGPPELPLGMSDEGPLVIDLAQDGPHALVAGTTGAGKSELLRTLVVGLAANHPPDAVNFVLVDFKGGSAFDRCGALPHVVGTVTDLERHLVGRMVAGLDAEIRRRERVLRHAGVSDLAGYHRLPAPRDEPLARLMVVVDEFATLAKQQPEALDALVSIAQRGRSLGVHLVLATQRPAGAVSDHIRANTNLRISLRVQDRADSTDVIDRPDAAAISRHQPGRALVRLGPGEVVAVQVAATSTTSAGGCRRALEVRDFGFGPWAGAARPTELEPSSGPPATTDLDRLVEAIGEAWERDGAGQPRKPWPEPLPGCVSTGDLVEAAAGADDLARVLPLALADDPSHQCRRVVGWEWDAGGLLLVGLPGSGTTTALATIALQAADRLALEQLHLYVLDFGAAELAPLAELPCVGAVVLAAERERQHRLFRHLGQELARRQSAGGSKTARRPRLVVLIDGVASLLSAWDDPLDGVADTLGRVLAAGPEVGIHVALTAERPGAAPLAWTATLAQRLVFALADPSDYASLGCPPRDSGSRPPGRAWHTAAGLLAQVARPPEGLTEAVARRTRGSHDSQARMERGASSDSLPPSATPLMTAGASSASSRYGLDRPSPSEPPPIGVLPREVELSPLLADAALDCDHLVVPIGVGDRDLAPVALALLPGDHALVAGPARSGRSTTLVTVAHAVLSAREAACAAPDLALIALAPGRSPLGLLDGPFTRWTAAPSWDQADKLAEVDRRVVVLVDDAERVADPNGTLARLLALPHVHVVAAGRADALRAAYGHWTREVRASRLGVLLDPDVDLDGDLLGATLPRRSWVPRAEGRGWLVAPDDLQVIQVARAMD